MEFWLGGVGEKNWIKSVLRVLRLGYFRCDRQRMRSKLGLISSTSCLARAVLPIPDNPVMAMMRWCSASIHCLRVASSSVRLYRRLTSGASLRSWRSWDGLSVLGCDRFWVVGRLLYNSLQKFILPNICVESEPKFDIWLNSICSRIDLRFNFLTSYPNTSERSLHRSEATLLVWSLLQW